MLLSIAVFSASFFAIAFSENVRAVNVPAVPCLCKTSLDSMQNSGTKYFASEADCDQYCSTNYGKNAVYALGIGGGEYKPVTKTSGTVVNTVHTCVCTNEGIYSNAITGTFAVNNESSCISQCRSFSSKIYQYDNKWKDLPVASDQVQASPKQFKYTLLESFPGFFQAKSELTDLPTMILAIYKFGIWTIGIAGLFMLVVGGFMYMASAGNTSTASNARGIIWDALLGIVAALGAYLILYVINPDLTKLNISFTKVDVEEVESVPAGGSILAEGRLTDVVARQNLSAAGISVNKANCSSPQATNCTSLEGIPAITISNLIALKNACKQFNASCSFVVTGGTEAGHKSHGSGNPMIDIREDAVVTSFLKDVKAKKQYANYAIGQVCTVSQNNLSSISYNHSYEKTCQDPSSVPHFHFSFSG